MHPRVLKQNKKVAGNYDKRVFAIQGFLPGKKDKGKNWKQTVARNQNTSVLASRLIQEI